MVTFIPNLAWSCRILDIKDEALWRVIDRMINRIYKYFNLDMLQSVIPSYYEIGRISSDQDKLFDALEKRFRELKQETSKTHLKESATLEDGSDEVSSSQDK